MSYTFASSRWSLTTCSSSTALVFLASPVQAMPEQRSLEPRPPSQNDFRGRLSASKSGEANQVVEFAIEFVVVSHRGPPRGWFRFGDDSITLFLRFCVDNRDVIWMRFRRHESRNSGMS